MIAAISNLTVPTSKVPVLKHRWLLESSCLAAFAVAAASAWSWRTRLPLPKFVMVNSNNNLKLEIPATTSIFDCKNPSASSSRNTHLVVLVHGWMGNSLEMNYLQQALKKEWEPHSSTSDSYLVVYSATCNEGRTSDGIEAGGTRLAAEVNQLLKQFREQSDSSSTSRLYLSLVGNSLGGLYSRHALSLLEWDLVNQALAFVTTATPHLGVSYPHTYIPLNRRLEWVVANALQQTGRDLFLQSRVVQQLATDLKYLEPLQRFQRRIAYANSFGTDFQVPTATAGFLSPTSSSTHTVKPPSSVASEPFVVLTAHTPATNKTTPSSSTEGNDSLAMVENLDALGWTKIFCDVRDSLPTIPLPFQRKSGREDLSTRRAPVVAMDRVTTSKELHSLLTNPSGSKWHFPAGHTVLVANSKNSFYANLNQWGRPIMDQLARDILQDLMTNTQSEMK